MIIIYIYKSQTDYLKMSIVEWLFFNSVMGKKNKKIQPALQINPDNTRMDQVMTQVNPIPNHQINIDEKYIEELYKSREYCVTEFDKGMTLISTGIFGISFAFIEKIVDLKKQTQGNSYLILGWSFLALSIVLSVSIHFINMHILDHYIQIFRKRKESKNMYFKKWSNLLIHSLNILTISLTIVGSLFIFYFIKINLPSK